MFEKLKEFLFWQYCEFMSCFKEQPYIFICNNYRFIYHLPIRLGIGHIQTLREDPKILSLIMKHVGMTEREIKEFYKKARGNKNA